MDKKISVIIPCYNATKWLPKCFMSLVGQTIGIDALELIFVNDASTDDGKTWEMLLEFERAYPESIAVIDLPENRRQGGARNEGLKYATGEFLAFVDADDWVVPEYFKKAYGRAKECDADIVQFGFDYYYENVGIIENPQSLKNELIVICHEDERRNMLIQEKFTYGCWNKLYRRTLVEKANVQYAEHVIYEEPLFVYPILFYGKRFVIMSDHFYIYRQNQSGTMRNDMKEKETLLQHAKVQLAVWNFMKQTPYFQTFYEEIKLYFLHTYLYEILDFAKQREMVLDYSMYEPLAKQALKEVLDITKSKYSKILVKQMELYRLIEEGLDEEKYLRFVESLCQVE
ncbi:MAG: glycosyltransferase family 2 protein [Lachnospiraceae bacterium]